MKSARSTGNMHNAQSCSKTKLMTLEWKVDDWGESPRKTLRIPFGKIRGTLGKIRGITTPPLKNPIIVTPEIYTASLPLQKSDRKPIGKERLPNLSIFQGRTVKLRGCTTVIHPAEIKHWFLLNLMEVASKSDVQYRLIERWESPHSNRIGFLKKSEVCSSCY